MDNRKLIFVGFELTAELQDQFANCQSRDRAYLDNPDYLEIVKIDEVSYVGKRTDDNIAIDRIEDIARSVVSLLARVCTGWSLTPDRALVIAAEEQSSFAVAEKLEETTDFDYSGLVD